MIALIMVVLDEADIIEANIRHHFAAGVDRAFIEDGGSRDGSWEILCRLAREYPITLTRDTEREFLQSERMSRLARAAHQAEADWVLPVDADEFWYPCEHPNFLAALAAVPLTVTKIAARMFAHHDWDHREVHPKPLAKVAFRSMPGVMVAVGNHDAAIPGQVMWGLLDLRELQYRSLAHLVAKARRGQATLDATPSIDRMDAVHTRRLGAMSDEELAAEWEQMQQVPTVWDPVPLAAPLSSPITVTAH